MKKVKVWNLCLKLCYLFVCLFLACCPCSNEMYASCLLQGPLSKGDPQCLQCCPGMWETCPTCWGNYHDCFKTFPRTPWHKYNIVLIEAGHPRLGWKKHFHQICLSWTSTEPWSHGIFLCVSSVDTDAAAQGVQAHGLLWDVKSTHLVPQGFILSLRDSLQLQWSPQSQRGWSRSRGQASEGQVCRVAGLGCLLWARVSSRKEFPPLEQPFRLQSSPHWEPGAKAASDYWLSISEKEHKFYDAFAPSDT